jgi:FAD:protein FMN transferase
MATHDFRCMASPIHLEVDAEPNAAQQLFALAHDVFDRYNAECSRFIADNSLARLNAAPTDWHQVSSTLRECLHLAHDAYVRTGGSFDPRVLTDIRRLGYRESIEKTHYSPDGALDRPTGTPPLPPWNPSFSGTAVRLDGWPVDLGGIAKGAAVAQVADLWRDRVSTATINAGGDLAAIGAGPEGTGWRIGIENPLNRDAEPLAVVEVTGKAVATSSVAIHHWTIAGEHVHHLIDPATGRPASGGILAVTVIAATATDAEVWSKSLFIAGLDAIEFRAAENDIAALWVSDTGTVALSPAAEQFTIWKADQ